MILGFPDEDDEYLWVLDPVPGVSGNYHLRNVSTGTMVAWNTKGNVALLPRNSTRLMNGWQLKKNGNSYILNFCGILVNLGYYDNKLRGTYPDEFEANDKWRLFLKK